MLKTFLKNTSLALMATAALAFSTMTASAATYGYVTQGNSTFTPLPLNGFDIMFALTSNNNGKKNKVAEYYGMTGANETRYTVGLNYWLTPSSVFKTAYEFDHQGGPNADRHNALLIQFVTGF